MTVIAAVPPPRQPSAMVDSVYRTRSLGVAAEGLPDQYADGKAAKVWEFYIGCKQSRTQQYKTWLCGLLRSRGCHTILDAACGTGVDSIMLVEEGFHVVSTDASDKMLKYALTERWDRRKDDRFDKWVIEEANWLSLAEDLHEKVVPKGGFDAVLCLGNSFAHLPDFEGQQDNQKMALRNFHQMVKPGGIMVIDHRNYDAILDTGGVPAKNVYYNSDHVKDIKCSNLYVNSIPTMVTLDYYMDMHTLVKAQEQTENGPSAKKLKLDPQNSIHHFRLSYYPHRLQAFNTILKEIFGKMSKHDVYGDFEKYRKEANPAYYVHVIQKAKS